MVNFRYKDIYEYIENELTPEEKEKFKDLIEHSKKRQAETKKNIESLAVSLIKLEKSQEDLSEAFTNLSRITKEAEKGIEKLKKTAEVLEYQNQILSAYKEKKDKYLN